MPICRWSRERWTQGYRTIPRPFLVPGAQQLCRAGADGAESDGGPREASETYAARRAEVAGQAVLRPRQSARLPREEQARAIALTRKGKRVQRVTSGDTTLVRESNPIWISLRGGKPPSRRTVDEAIYVRAPALFRALARLTLKLPRGLRLRQAVIRRSVLLSMGAWMRRDFEAGLIRYAPGAVIGPGEGDVRFSLDLEASYRGPRWSPGLHTELPGCVRRFDLRTPVDGRPGRRRLRDAPSPQPSRACQRSFSGAAERAPCGATRRTGRPGGGSRRSWPRLDIPRAGGGPRSHRVGSKAEGPSPFIAQRFRLARKAEARPDRRSLRREAHALDDTCVALRDESGPRYSERPANTGLSS